MAIAGYLCLLIAVTALTAYLDYREIREGNFEGYRDRLWFLGPGVYALVSLHDAFEGWEIPEYAFLALGVLYFAVFVSLPKILTFFFVSPDQ